MLLALSIRNIVLIERLELSFKSGLCVLTGETGAGKSILLDALGLALGVRADPTLIREQPDGGDQASASVSASFDLPPDHPVIALLDEHGLEAPPPGEPLLLRRTLNAEGRSRAFVNDQPVAAQLLRTIGDSLVEIVGQFASHTLTDRAQHRAALDRFGGHEAALARVRATWRDWRSTRTALSEAEAAVEAASREEAFLRHAVEELQALAPETGEEARLAERRHTLRHAERLGEALAEAFSAVSESEGAEDRLAAAHRALARRTDVAAGMLDDALEALDRAAAEAAEARAAVEKTISTLEADPHALDTVEERLFALRAMARKHDVEPDGLAALHDELGARLASIDNAASTLAALRDQAAEARTAYVDAAGTLSAARAKSATRLDKAVKKELGPLRLETARFVTTIEAAEEADWGPDGVERVEFTAATNPDSAPGPLSKVASGGELSRFLLALKVVLAGTSAVPTMVFDEVDAGIGGATSTAVGQRLRRLGEGVQVLVVTHSPQVAALGETHWRVHKRESGKQAKRETRTIVDELAPEDRREEIARMLAGVTITDEARAAAASLMSGGAG